MERATVTQLAFLIQLRPESAAAEKLLTGRVEHIASGDVAHFQSPDELLDFIEHELKQLNKLSQST